MVDHNLRGEKLPSKVMLAKIFLFGSWTLNVFKREVLYVLSCLHLNNPSCKTSKLNSRIAELHNALFTTDSCSYRFAGLPDTATQALREEKPTRLQRESDFLQPAFISGILL